MQKYANWWVNRCPLAILRINNALDELYTGLNISFWLLTHGEYCLVWFVGLMLWLWTSASSKYCVFNHSCLNSPLLYSLLLLPMGIMPTKKSLFFCFLKAANFSFLVNQSCSTLVQFYMFDQINYVKLDAALLIPWLESHNYINYKIFF